jgi:non-ribosomal peptide synthase protein (TIGR01720 family)
VYIVDPQTLQPVPVGVAGELLVGGDGLARGYHRHPELTAEKFITEEVGGSGKQRLYRTGDLVRYRANGEVEFLGRLDQQVKIRGYRIELAEIERVIQEHEAVRGCVVAASDQGSGGQRLVAYVKTGPDALIDSADLRRFSRTRLPEYMLPTAFVAVDDFPLTPNGKIDRDRLPAPPPPAVPGGYTTPSSAKEEILVAVWKKMFGLERISVQSNFFELGGDSILSIQAVFEAKQRGLHITAKQVFQCQTIAELAEVAEFDSGSIPEEVGPGRFPLTPIQQWFFETFPVGRDHFNQCVLLTVKEKISLHDVERALARLVEHHDCLRLRFHEDGSRRWQEYAPQETHALVLSHDLSALPAQERAGAIEDLCGRLQSQLNVTEGPLVRAAWIRLAESDHRLFLTIHHLASDGVSWRILLSDLESLLVPLCHQREAVLPPKTASYKRWAERLHEYSQSPDLGSENAHWWSVAARRPQPLSVDFPAGENSSSSTRSETAQLDEEDTRILLREAPHALHAEIDHFLLTALQHVMERWTGQIDLAVDIESHGRQELFDGLDISRTVGWFTSLYPVLLESPQMDSLSRRIASIKAQIQAVSQRGIGYGLLRYANSSTAPLLCRGAGSQVLFNFLGQLDSSISGSSLFEPAPESTGSERAAESARPYVFEINCCVLGGRLQCSWSYSAALHRPETVRNLVREFAAELRRIAACAASGESSALVASDFAAARMSETDFTNLFQEITRGLNE